MFKYQGSEIYEAYLENGSLITVSQNDLNEFEEYFADIYKKQINSLLEEIQSLEEDKTSITEERDSLQSEVYDLQDALAEHCND